MSNPSQINSFCAWHKNYPLTKPIVNHDHNRVKATDHGEVNDQVNRKVLEGTGDVYSKRGQPRVAMHVGKSTMYGLRYRTMRLISLPSQECYANPVSYWDQGNDTAETLHSD